MLDRRAFLGGLATAGAAAPLLGPRRARAEEVRQITFLTYGGLYGDNQKAAMIDPFVKETGLQVQIVTGRDAVPALIGDTRQSTPTYDVIAFADLELYTVLKQGGLLAPLDADRLPNARRLPDVAKELPYAVNEEFDPWGVLYRSDKMPAPDSWMAVFDPKDASRTAMQRPTAGSGTFYNFLAAAVAAGGTQKDVLGKGIPLLKSLKAKEAQFLDFSASLSGAQNDSVDLAPMYNNESYFLADQGLPIGFAFPKEGVFPIGVWLGVPANMPEPRRRAAERFIDWMISPEPQAAMAKLMYTGPTNLDAKLDPALAVKVLSATRIDQAVRIDWSDIVQNQQAWLDAWNREIAG